MFEKKDIIRPEFETLPGIDEDSIISRTLSMAHSAFRLIASDEEVAVMLGDSFFRTAARESKRSADAWEKVSDVRSKLFEADEMIHGHNDGNIYPLEVCKIDSLAAFNRNFNERVRARMCADYAISRELLR